MSRFADAVNDAEVLGVLLGALAEAETAVCDGLYSQQEYSVRIDMRGNRGRIDQVKIITEKTHRPKGATKK